MRKRGRNSIAASRCYARRGVIKVVEGNHLSTHPSQYNFSVLEYSDPTACNHSIVQCGGNLEEKRERKIEMRYQARCVLLCASCEWDEKMNEYKECNLSDSNIYSLTVSLIEIEYNWKASAQKHSGYSQCMYTRKPLSLYRKWWAFRVHCLIIFLHSTPLTTAIAL